MVADADADVAPTAMYSNPSPFLACTSRFSSLRMLSPRPWNAGLAIMAIATGSSSSQLGTPSLSDPQQQQHIMNKSSTKPPPPPATAGIKPLLILVSSVEFERVRVPAPALLAFEVVFPAAGGTVFVTVAPMVVGVVGVVIVDAATVGEVTIFVGGKGRVVARVVSIGVVVVSAAVSPLPTTSPLPSVPSPPLPLPLPPSVAPSTPLLFLVVFEVNVVIDRGGEIVVASIALVVVVVVLAVVDDNACELPPFPTAAHTVSDSTRRRRNIKGRGKLRKKALRDLCKQSFNTRRNLI